MLNKLKSSKKGASGNSMINWGIGILILIQVLIMVFSTDGILNADFVANAPPILLVLLPLIITAAVVGFVRRK